MWVDIPNWVADYYLAVQVNPDDGWIKVYAYTTHQRLKAIGVYNEDTATTPLNVLYLEVMLQPGEGLVWQIEPTPEDWKREIFRF